jgi:hypothetical protein
VQNLLPSLLLFTDIHIKICSSIILPLDLYGCHLLSQVKGRHTLRMFQKRKLRRIFGGKTDEVTEGQRNLHNEMNNNDSEIGEACSTHGDIRNV